MDVVLLHDDWLLPVDLYRPMEEAGHRVVSHGADPTRLADFLPSMRWRPQAIVVDGRGRPELAEATLRWLSATPPWSAVPVVVAHPPDKAEDAASVRDALPDAPWARDAAELLAHLARFGGTP